MLGWRSGSGDGIKDYKGKRLGSEVTAGSQGSESGLMSGSGWSQEQEQDGSGPG